MSGYKFGDYFNKLLDEDIPEMMKEPLFYVYFVFVLAILFILSIIV